MGPTKVPSNNSVILQKFLKKYLLFLVAAFIPNFLFDNRGKPPERIKMPNTAYDKHFVQLFSK